MKKRKKIYALPVFFVMAAMFLFTWITPSIPKEHAPNDEGCRKVEDQAKRELCLPVYPQRIVSLCPSITEIVFSVGAGDRLVGVTTYSDYPPQAKSIFKVGSYVSLDIERIVSLKPDLVFAVKDGNPKDAVMRIESFGIPVFVLNPTNLESVMDSVLRLGDALDCMDQARSVVSGMQAKIMAVEKRVLCATGRPRVFFQVGISPIVSAGKGTFIDELIRMAGGINVAEEMSGYPRFSTEQVISMAPDFILVATMDIAGGFVKAKSFWMRFDMIPACAKKHVFLVPADLVNRPSPRLVDGLRIIAKTIHPECFKKSGE